MTQEKATLMMLKGVISDLPEDERKKVEQNAKVIRDHVRATEGIGELALVLVAAELAASASP